METGSLTVACAWVLGKKATPIIPLQSSTRSAASINSPLQVPEHVTIASMLGLVQLVP